MFLLWKRERAGYVAVKTLGVSPDLLTVTWADYDHFMWIERAGERIGGYALLVRRLDLTGGYEMSSQVRMDLPILNRMFSIQMDLAVLMDDLFQMKTFNGVMNAAGEKITVEAFVDNQELFYRLKGPEFFVTGGGVTSKMKLDQPIMLADAIRPVVLQNDKLRIGNKWETLASDPISGRFNMPVRVEVVAQENIEIEGERMDVFRVTESAGEMTSTSWYDAEGKVVKTDMGNGLVLIRANRKEAEQKYSEFKSTLTFDLTTTSAIRAEAIERSYADNKNLMPWLPEF